MTAPTFWRPGQPKKCLTVQPKFHQYHVRHIGIRQDPSALASSIHLLLCLVRSFARNSIMSCSRTGCGLAIGHLDIITNSELLKIHPLWSSSLQYEDENRASFCGPHQTLHLTFFFRASILFKNTCARHFFKDMRSKNTYLRVEHQ